MPTHISSVKGCRLDTDAMTIGDPTDAALAARSAVVGQKIAGLFFLHDFIEVHLGDVILTGMTKPFGLIGCQGIGPSSMVSLIGDQVEEFTVVDGEYVAIDFGENRLAFPIGGPTATGPESVRLVRLAQPELGIGQAMWVW